MTLIIDVSIPKSTKTRRVVLEDQQELLVGRSNEKTLLTSDPRLSRKHFRIRHVGGAIEVEHLSQTNPTLIAPENSRDFQQVRGTVHQPENCRIIAGSHRFVLTLEKAETLEHDSLPEIDTAQSWSDMDDDHVLATGGQPPADEFSAPTRVNLDSDGPQFRFDDSMDEQEARRELEQPHGATRFFDSEPGDSKPAPRVKTKLEPPHPLKVPSEDQPKKETSPPAESRKPIDFDDESQDGTEPSPPSKKKTPEKPAKPKSEEKDRGGFPKKMIFPVADNFFDD